MVNPGGTGNPMRHISARLAPLPPSSGFIVPLPSVLRPKRYTYFPPLFAERAACVVFLDFADCFEGAGFAAAFFRASVLAITVRFAPVSGDLHSARASSLAPFRSL